MGRVASFRPMGVRAGPRSEDVPVPRSSNAPISTSRLTPSRIARVSGGSTNGKRATSPRPRAAICRMTAASEVRRISGSVNSGRDS